MAKSEPKAVNPQGVFNHAYSFFSTLDQLHRTTATDQRFVEIAGPMIVLTAFCCQLFLKCLYAIENNGDTIATHLLLDLFEKLTPEAQARLEGHWDKIQVERKEMLDQVEKREGKPIPRDLRSNLAEANDLFRLVRYFYERPPSFGFYISDLPVALCTTLKDLKPAWFLQRTTQTK